jgi:hypothetical protein
MILMIVSAMLVSDHEIFVEHKYENQINASTIADAVDLVDLNRNYHNISHLVIGDKYLIVSPGEEDLKGFSNSVALFSKDGTFMEELYRGKNIIQSLAYDKTSEHLYIAHNDKIVVYDVRHRNQKAQFEVKNSLSNIAFFSGRIYAGTVKFESGKKTYLIEAFDSKDYKSVKTAIEMVYDTEKAHPAVKIVSRRNSFSSGNGSLYVSFGEANDIYSSKNEFIRPVARLKNLYQSNDGELDIFLSGNQGIIGKFATTSFRHRGNKYLLFYDLKNRKQYLSESSNKSGLYDDFNHSGYYTPKFTNLNPYMYAYTNKDEKTSIVLFKVKS